MLTKPSLVVRTATLLTFSAPNLAADASRPGRCLSVHVGVKAPGMPTMMVVPFPMVSARGAVVSFPPFPALV